MVEEMKLKGGNLRDELLASSAKPRPVNTGRHAREEPLLGADEPTEGRAVRAAPRKAGFVLGTILAIGAVGFAGCDDGKSGDEVPDAGWDAGECTDCPEDTDSDTYMELCGEPGSEIQDNQALLAVGQKAVFTRSGRNIEVVELDAENGVAVVRLAEEGGEALDNGHFGYDEMSSDDPLLSVGGDEPTQTMAFCGTESSEAGIAAKIATDRENGFVHCEDIDSGADSVPVEHEIDATTVEVLVSSTHSGGQLAVDGDTEDCDPETDTLTGQVITFQDNDAVQTSLTSRNVLLFSEAQTLKIHELVEGTLQTFEVDLYEVDGIAGTAKIGTSKLGVGILGLGASVVANEELRVTLNSFDGAIPDFSFSYEPDMDALVWTTETANPNEVEVNVVSGDTTKIYVVRFSNDKGDSMVDVTILEKSALFVLGSGSESNLDGKIYNDETETDATGVTKIKLTPAV